MRAARATTLAVVLLGASFPAFGASEGLETLEEAFAVETRLFEAAFLRYRTIRGEQRQSLEALKRASREAEAALQSQTLGVAVLWDLDAAAEGALHELVAVSSRAGEHRRTVLRHLERLTELGTAIERLRDRSLVRTEKLDGRWRLELSPSEVGLLDLRLDGTLVTGAYRLSGGEQGSVRGTYANHRLELERVDTVGGVDMRLSGVHDPETGEISGRWETRGPSDVSGSAGGRDAVTGAIRGSVETPEDEGELRDLTGEWAARKISPSQEE
ncbi:MAG: hypothetical protein KDD11_03445 [Acidobacteria bacterium]|nr:hypothetical protein [Acidobacteriota bacterium]